MFRGSLPSNAAMKDQQNDVEYDSSALVQQCPAWRGRFNIPSLNLDINIVAHVSKNACSKVLEVASAMPASLHLEMIHRLDVWPASFESSPPTEHNTALLFFPERRDEDVLDNLLTHTINADFALKSMIGEAELLIFTSLQLPQNFHRFYGKPYFWGVFRGQQTGAAASHQSDYHAHVQNIKASQSLSLNSGNHSNPKGKGSRKTISSDNSSLSQASNADRRGRRLDIAWEHAKPLNASRQKAECKYCGFVSLHGGISRLKAHLGGGSPGLSLPGCDKVSPDVKKVMSEWFGEWLKNTRALWAKEIKAESAEYVASEHAKPIDVASQRTDDNYFTSESLPTGIPLHTNLGREDSKMHHEDQPKVLVSEWMRNLTTSTTKKSQDGMRPETRGRRLDDAWKHAIPLDPIRQKTQCKHCGFVSQYGGISRLKAHLGGGCPQMQLQDCPRVSLEVKRVMEQWFNEWAKNSSAAWIGKSHGTSPKPSKRKKPVDNTWEHATLLDEMGQATKCKYCGYISRFGGIARLKAHLAGGDPITQLEGCPNVPPEIRTSISIGKKKKAKGVPVEPTRSELQGTGRASLMEAHKSEVLRETLDEISNTSLKGRLQKLIEEKNDTLRKMHFEVQILGKQLASIP
ncbi:hypothetical protein ACS0TY_014025 [Phlomoides rotata]